MIYRRILICAIMLVGILLVGCGSEDGGDNDGSLTEMSLRGGKTSLTMPLPFTVKNAPKDESESIPPELKEIILKSERYQAGEKGIYLNATYSIFKEGLFASLSEEDLYAMLNEELTSNVEILKNDGKFSNLQVTSNKTQIDGNPALIATATYTYEGKDAKSIMIYTLHGDDFWRLIFDYMASDAKADSIVNNAVQNIKIK